MSTPTPHSTPGPAGASGGERTLADRRSLAIGLGVPMLMLLIVIPVLSDTDVHVAGVPLLFVLLFAAMPITSAALWVAWRLDAPRYEADLVDEAPHHDGEGER